ncbi:CPBP family intramembrane glutamic endopeptidase [Metabacillus malikii]|uniref:Membrane protease YdiL (CAAX protease family) n=1 Tax=Metabacillus malikii TaxID=1504265 RepID=A0ABT9ZBF1_9BACI|nr:CPBP family intramembrane glutamic endopeptidase [Metabacillus malikii]MDQ0229162.1 membrane protease YdiL (CAAX protease family) [Metabacillus malikii]
MVNVKVNNHYIWVYFMIFFTIWCIRELWFVQYLDLIDPVPRAIASAVTKLVIWIIPVIFIINIVENTDPYSFLGLRKNIKKGLISTGWVTLVFISYFVVVNIIILGKNINFQIEFNQWLNTVLLVGITEEIVFRGFLLRKLIDSYKFWIANTITSLLFVSIHFPIWLYKGLFQFPNILGSIISVFVLSIIFGFVYKKSNSLWSVIIVHSSYNLFVLLFY